MNDNLQRIQILHKLDASAVIYIAKEILIKCFQREFFLSEVNNREIIAAIEANNDTYCLKNE